MRAVECCKHTDGALIRLGDDVSTADWERLRATLQRERIRIYMPGRPTDDGPATRRYEDVKTGPMEPEHFPATKANH